MVWHTCPMRLPGKHKVSLGEGKAEKLPFQSLPTSVATLAAVTPLAWSGLRAGLRNRLWEHGPEDHTSGSSCCLVVCANAACFESSNPKWNH